MAKAGKVFKIAMIGTGGRSVSYARHYVDCKDLKVVAMADPLPQNRKAMVQRTGLKGKIAEYDDWREMLDKHKDLDGCVICSPNHVHADQGVACLERGMRVILEKPIAQNKEGCDRLWAAEINNEGRSAIGFSLRTSAFYEKVAELVLGGAVGRVNSIQADELIGWGVSSIINRNEFKRFVKYYGSLILSKTCHDIDILNWLMGCRVTATNSFGSRRIFTPNPSLPETCDKCGVAKTCRYYKEPTLAEGENPDDKHIVEMMRDNNRCIYNIEKDVIDTQVASFEYESGAVANFTITMNTAGPKSTRNIHVVGMRGRVWGNVAEKKVYHYDNESEKLTVHEPQDDGSGHGGGDKRLAMTILDMMKDPDHQPLQSMQAGYNSAIACLAAEQSRLEGRRVDIVYDTEGFAEIW